MEVVDENFDGIMYETIEYPGNTIGERVHNEKNMNRLEQLYMEPVSRPPRHFKVIVFCHGAYPVARTQDKALINELKEASEMDYHWIRGREQQHIPPFLNAIKFYVSSSHILRAELKEDIEILRKTNIPFHKSEKQFQVNYQEEDATKYKYMNRELVKTLMRLFCNDRSKTIITHRPTVPGKMWLRPMVLNFNPIDDQGVDANNFFKEGFGLWICSAENIPKKIKGWKDRYIMSNNYTHDFDDIIEWSSEAVINEGLRNGDTCEICLVACRTEPNLEKTTTPLEFIDTTKPESEVPRQHYTAWRGGREPQPLKKNLVQIKEDIQKEEYEQFNEEGFAQVTEEQFEYFSEGHSIPEVIEHLTDENVESIIEMSNISPMINNGGSKIRKIIKRRTKRNKKYKTRKVHKCFSAKKYKKNKKCIMTKKIR